MALVVRYIYGIAWCRIHHFIFILAHLNSFRASNLLMQRSASNEPFLKWRYINLKLPLPKILSLNQKVIARRMHRIKGNSTKIMKTPCEVLRQLKFFVVLKHQVVIQQCNKWQATTTTTPLQRRSNVA